MREIGSEFQLDSAQIGINADLMSRHFPVTQYVLSGRTGLAVIADELIKRNAKTVALPAYSCSSMVYPFFDKGLSIVFYQMPESFEQTTESELAKACEVTETADAVLVMDYFGFIRDFAYQLALRSKNIGKAIIVDSTQTAFCNVSTYPLADYCVTSYRKWSDLLCAAVSAKEPFGINADTFSVSKEYINLWRTAAEKKKNYLICGGSEEKNSFLQLYSVANTRLTKEYIGCATDNEEIEKLHNVDSRQLVTRRRENAQYLINTLKALNNENLRLVFDRIEDGDCPLFVPILVDVDKKDSIRKNMAEKGIYCPAHWPIVANVPHYKTKYHSCEISLICDQRYTLADMEKEIKVLLNAIAG
jgi:hypothetical protein